MKKQKKDKLKDIYIDNWIFRSDLLILIGDYSEVERFCRKILDKNKGLLDEQEKLEKGGYTGQIVLHWNIS